MNYNLVSGGGGSANQTIDDASGDGLSLPLIGIAVIGAWWVYNRVMT